MGEGPAILSVPVDPTGRANTIGQPQPLLPIQQSNRLPNRDEWTGLSFQHFPVRSTGSHRVQTGNEWFVLCPKSISDAPGLVAQGLRRRAGRGDLVAMNSDFHELDNRAGELVDRDYARHRLSGNYPRQ
jgi:hypothetical protein